MFLVGGLHHRIPTLEGTRGALSLEATNYKAAECCDSFSAISSSSLALLLCPILGLQLLLVKTLLLSPINLPDIQVNSLKKPS